MARIFPLSWFVSSVTRGADFAAFREPPDPFFDRAPAPVRATDSGRAEPSVYSSSISVISNSSSAIAGSSSGSLSSMSSGSSAAIGAGSSSSKVLTGGEAGGTGGGGFRSGSSNGRLKLSESPDAVLRPELGAGFLTIEGEKTWPQTEHFMREPAGSRDSFRLKQVSHFGH